MNDTGRHITPIFVFSLPRSGSTLTQRILATHPAVDTASEPWILLPLLYTRARYGIYAEYQHGVAYKAIEDFCEDLPGGEDSYLTEIRELALRLYARRARPGARYFVDKTPRYHVIASQILRTFPEAPCVFLWRNPLAIVASIIETWGHGRWNLYEFYFDLYDGLECLVRAFREAGSRACSVRFLDLLGEDSTTREQLFRHIGLSYDEIRASHFAVVELTGRMGDQVGSGKYFALDLEPLEKWKKTLASPLRKWWCRRYLSWIGGERLAVMGYDQGTLLRDLDAIPTRYRTAIPDLARMLFGSMVRIFEPWIVRDKLARRRRGGRQRVHA